MVAEPTPADYEAYWTSSGLEDIFRSLPPDPEALAPDIRDLVRLHRLVRERPCVTVLELGVGYSTVVFAHALELNDRELGDEVRSRITRNTHLFEVHGVDADERWIQRTRDRLPADLARRVHLTHSPVRATTFADRLCHTYDRLPDLVPDLIYLDGPHAGDVEGSVLGLSFAIPERTVMGADILVMEPTLLPGTVIVVDGRENNTRFLTRNLQRPFALTVDDDVTVIELVEPRLGRIDVIGVDVFGRPGER